MHARKANYNTKRDSNECMQRTTYLATSSYSFKMTALLSGDINGDGNVDIFDLVIVVRDYGQSLPRGLARLWIVKT